MNVYLQIVDQRNGSFRWLLMKGNRPFSHPDILYAQAFDNQDALRIATKLTTAEPYKFVIAIAAETSINNQLTPDQMRLLRLA